MALTPEQVTAAAAEEARAALYRRQRVRRVQFQSHLWRSLAGNPVTYQAFMAAWSPLIEYLAERDDLDIDSQVEIDPLGISNTVNVGR